MNPAFQKVFDVLELQRRKTLESVNHLSQEQLHRAPAEGKWSVAQILSHIITAERLSVLYIRKKMLGAAQASDTGVWEEVKFLLLRISQRLPGLKFKAPKNVEERTEVYPDLTTIVHEWDLTREDLRSVLEKIPDEFVRRKIYRHVRAGYLNVKQGLLFLREHIIHHTPQLKKLLSHKWNQKPT